MQTANATNGLLVKWVKNRTVTYVFINSPTHIVYDGSFCVMTQTMLTNADVPVGVNFPFNTCLHQTAELHIRKPTVFLNRNEHQWRGET